MKWVTDIRRRYLFNFAGDADDDFIRETQRVRNPVAAKVVNQIPANAFVPFRGSFTVRPQPS
jgi:hypothetical protein